MLCSLHLVNPVTVSAETAQYACLQYLPSALVWDAWPGGPARSSAGGHSRTPHRQSVLPIHPHHLTGQLFLLLQLPACILSPSVQHALPFDAWHRPRPVSRRLSSEECSDAVAYLMPENVAKIPWVNLLIGVHDDGEISDAGAQAS